MEYMIKGKTLGFTPVQVEDAKFILELRKDETLGKFLSVTDNSLETQQEWIKNYKTREADGIEYYFRVDSLDGDKIGFLRIYNIDKISKTFTWGSWIFKKDRPKTSAIESALMIYEFCFLELGMDKAIFDVMKENEGIVFFHTRFGATVTGENERDILFELPKDLYLELKKERYQDFIK